MSLNAASLSRRLNAAGFRDHGFQTMTYYGGEWARPVPGSALLWVDHYHWEKLLTEIIAWLRAGGFEVTQPRAQIVIVSEPTTGSSLSTRPEPAGRGARG